MAGPVIEEKVSDIRINGIFGALGILRGIVF